MLCQTQVIGNRRIPKESVLARLFSRPGDAYDPAVVERDFNSLWNTGYFDDVRIERVDDADSCVQLIIYVREKPDHPRDQLQGPERGLAVGRAGALQEGQGALSVESQYDPTRSSAPKWCCRSCWASTATSSRPSRPKSRRCRRRAVALTFIIKEGPTVKVGKIAFDGNTALSDRELRRVDAQPEADRHSALDHSSRTCFAKTFDASKLDEDAERVRYAYRDKGYFKAHDRRAADQRSAMRAASIRSRCILPRGKRVDIMIPVEEGERYRLGGITFTGNKALYQHARRCARSLR